MRTTAAVLRQATEPFVIEELEIEDPRPGEVLVKVVGAGLCHTDLLLTNPDAPFPLPMVLGHEGAGIVEAVGAGVTKVQPGDQVVLSYASCGRCLRCQTGSPQYCDLFYPLNFFGGRLDGSSPLSTPSGDRVGGCWFGQSSFATYALATERNVVKIEADDVPLEILGPLGCGIQTGAGAVFNSLDARAGQTIVVTGVGAVGLSGVMAARVAGCSTIVAVDLHDSRLELAIELGATHTINARATPDLTAALSGIVPGGLHLAFDTSAVPAVIRAAVAALRPHGVACLVGAGGGDIAIEASGFLFGKTVKGVIEGDAVPDEFIPRLVELYRQGSFPIDRLVSRYRLDQINEAISHTHAGAAVKPVFVFD